MDIHQNNSVGRRIKDVTKVTPIAQECLDTYHKRPKVTKFKFTDTMVVPDLYFHYVTLDNLWFMSFNFLDDEPLWTGWNALRYNESQPQQRVEYLKPIRLSPNRIDVVHETLVRTQKISAECGSDYALASYDLLIAKVAKQIQCIEHPKFENVFIQFGQGRFIEGSGGPYILIQAGIIAAGSMNKFLKGKMYNRCRRGHLLRYSALQGIHFDRFLEECTIDQSLFKELKAWNQMKNDKPPGLLTNIVQKFENFKAETRAGKHGKTAQFWMTYCKIVELYLILHRAVKISNVDMYGFALFELAGIFFMTNHMNYARWMTFYALELVHLKYERPDLQKVLENGGFSINRSGKTLARTGIDMTLEQTINAEAKSRLKGIIPFADVSTAVNRWMVTGSTRTEVVNRLLEITELSSKTSDSKELNIPRKARDKEDLGKLKKSIYETVNPFGLNVCPDVLFNMRTGKQADQNVEEYLLNFIENGNTARDEFVRESLDDD